ncbi:hypothetical protein EN742_16065 [Mesorhizobium sp. M4A.F.Ca.ET.020.02.1.1]|uniref:hypothetical protein n=1 Tax=Mesorhizobium sp. M4A.F.Ca.ET.020.02.1.1 TaxID=2496652 RepID=UPI000FD2033D|nr:hypothetical protein [Mesorhizobium sp. M4A.F.Ca.ET.020.02.1.1]RVD39054.1 hypothetical protein EN742_16065 [Mesorhizobium sp. M4A.F.Ca.ET.020.02.1.1]
MRISSEARLASAVAIITVGFVLADIWWSRSSNISLDPRSWIEFAKVMALLAVVFVVMKAIEHRLEADRSKPGRSIRHAAESLRWVTVNAALFIPLGFASDPGRPTGRSRAVRRDANAASSREIAGYIDLET